MKCSFVQITLPEKEAALAAKARLDNPDDTGVETEEQAASYKGATFKEDGESCSDLHVVYRDGFVQVNFDNEEGVRINYDYPILKVNRVKRY